MEQFEAREGVTMLVGDVGGVYRDLCLPVLESIIYNCGERHGVDMQSIAKS